MATTFNEIQHLTVGTQAMAAVDPEQRQRHARLAHAAWPGTIGRNLPAAQLDPAA